MQTPSIAMCTHRDVGVHTPTYRQTPLEQGVRAHDMPHSIERGHALFDGVAGQLGNATDIELAKDM